MRKRRQPLLEANRRNDLVRAAAFLFVSKGFMATTTRDIANAVGMRSGSPFYHFRSKQELLKTAIIEGLEAGCQRLQEAIAGIDDPEQRLRKMMRAHLDHLFASDCQAPLLLYEVRWLEPSTRVEVAALADRYQQPWQTTLDELASLGRLPSSAPPLRLLLFGMLNWSSQWFRPDGDLSLDAIAEAAADLLLA